MCLFLRSGLRLATLPYRPDWWSAADRGVALRGMLHMIHGPPGLEGAHYCVGFHMSVAMTGPGIPSNGPGCRDGCPSGRFSSQSNAGAPSE